MTELDFLEALTKCELCEHRCKVNRLAGETGVCRVTMPAVASATLHPAPPESYTVFMAGCNYKCLNCQNWTISQYPDNGLRQRGFEDPRELAEECVDQLTSLSAKLMGADRIFFSGGEPTIHLPYIEKMVEEARKIRPDTKVNFDTNGYLTEQSLERVLGFTTSITYDLKAYTDEVHLALTGASSKPVLRNIKPLTEFIAGIDPSLPVCFLAFRPNFALENHPGAGRSLMDRCVEMAKDSGLENAYWSGSTGLPGMTMNVESETKGKYVSEEARLAASYAHSAGCKTHPRGCSTCTSNQACAIKKYIPKILT